MNKYGPFEILIEYDGAYPNLCSGHLVVHIDGLPIDFGSGCLHSGGSVTFDDEWNENVQEGPWGIEFPEHAYLNDAVKLVVKEAINDQLDWGCCGGCV